MDGLQRTPPKFVPTLTEVVTAEALETSDEALHAHRIAQPLRPASASWVTPQMKEALAQRVMKRVGESLEPRLGDAVAAIARQHSEALAQHLRDNIEDLVSELVADAVAAELSAQRQGGQPL